MFFPVRMTVLIAFMTATAVGAQDGRRPTAPDPTPADRLRADLEAQQRRLDEYPAVARRYADYFTAQKQVIDTARTNVRSAEQLADQAQSSWNTRVNPTCTNGHTFAACSCNPGRAGKARLQDVIDRAADLERQQRRTLSSEIRTYNDNVDRQRRFIDQWRQDVNAFNTGVETLKRMSAPRPTGSPDSIDDILKRSKGQ